MKILAILRDPCYSPNSVAKDEAIMMAVVGRLRACGHEVTIKGEAEVDGLRTEDGFAVILSMGRLPQTLYWLKTSGARVINQPDGVARCSRSTLADIMRTTGIPVPPSKGGHGYWLKRGDTAAQGQGDVVFAADEAGLNREIDKLRQRGITSYTVSAHVVGDVVKFYGVLPPYGEDVQGLQDFFRYYYPTDDGESKFGDERLNGPAHHYAFDAGELQYTAERLARAVGIEVYGGDCIVRQDGTFCVIDFNDWPSFSRCREEAARAIVKLIKGYGDI